MNILRIIISCALVGMAGLMMVQDLSKSSQYAFELGLGDYRAPNLKAWERERDFESWMEKQFEVKGEAYVREAKNFLLEGDEAKQIELEQTLANWNQLEDERSKLEGRELDKENVKVAAELAELQKQSEVLRGLIFKLAQLQPGTLEVPRLSAPSKKAIPQIKTEKSSTKPLSLPKSKAPSVKATAAEPAVVDSSNSYQIQATIESMSQMVLKRIEGLEQSLVDLKSQDASSGLLNELRGQRENETSVANQSLKLIFTELRSFQKSLKEDLAKTHQFIAKMGGHQTELWYHEKNMMMERLGLQRSTLERKIEQLQAQPKLMPLSPIYAKINAQEKELSQGQVAESFKLLLGGFLMCLLFNLVWEMIAQRKGV